MAKYNFALKMSKAVAILHKKEEKMDPASHVFLHTGDPEKRSRLLHISFFLFHNQHEKKPL